MSGFAPRSVHAGLVVDEVALREFFLRVPRFSSVLIIPPKFHILSFIICRTDKGPVSGPAPQRETVSPRNNDNNNDKKTCTVFGSCWRKLIFLNTQFDRFVLVALKLTCHYKEADL
jgi:hypothetical protein